MPKAMPLSPNFAVPSKDITSFVFRNWIGLLLAMPAIVLMLALLIGPVVLVALMSLTDYSLGDASFNWIGLSNYKEMSGDTIFQKAISNTVIYALIVIPGSVLLGLIAALLIEGLAVGKSWWRAV